MGHFIGKFHIARGVHFGGKATIESINRREIYGHIVDSTAVRRKDPVSVERKFRETRDVILDWAYEKYACRMCGL
jgi:hypothetical protein